jgi:hypothetical protein
MPDAALPILEEVYPPPKGFGRPNYYEALVISYPFVVVAGFKAREADGGGCG